MATSTTWTGNASDGLWETAGNWDNGVPQAGYDVALPSKSNEYSVSLSSYAPVGSLAIGNYNGTTNPITLILASGANLHASGAINIAKYGIIEGQGTLQADGGFGVIYSGSGSAQILAGTATSGGDLSVTGVIDNNILLGFANTTIATTLDIASTNTTTAINIASSFQTLEVGANLTFNLAASVV